MTPQSSAMTPPPTGGWAGPYPLLTLRSHMIAILPNFQVGKFLRDFQGVRTNPLEGDKGPMIGGVRIDLCKV